MNVEQPALIQEQTVKNGVWGGLCSECGAREECGYDDQGRAWIHAHATAIPVEDE